MTKHSAACHRIPSQARGFSLVELMVAMLLSLILLAGVLAIFASSRTTYETTDRLSRIQESGRLALDIIVRDLRAAGYRGCRRRADFTNALNSAATPMWDFERPVFGFDNADPDLTTDVNTAAGVTPTAGNDVLIIRGPIPDVEPVRVLDGITSTTAALTVSASPAVINAGDIVLVSDCNARGVFQVTGAGGGVLEHSDASAEAPGNATEDIGYAYTNMAEVVRMQSIIYYLADGTTAGAGTSLWRRVNGNVSEEVVEGVENMQIEFGEQEGNTVVYGTAAAVADWNNVVTVRLALLVRSLSEYGTDVGPASFELFEEDVANPGDRNMRQIFTTTVNVRNNAS